MDSSLARDLVRATQVSTLREMATLYARANDLDDAAVALPQHAETLTVAARVLRQMADQARAVEKSLNEVVALLHVERLAAPRDETRPA